MNVARRVKRVRFTNLEHNLEAAPYLRVRTSPFLLQRPVKVHLANSTLRGYQVSLLLYSIKKSCFTIFYQLPFSDGHHVLHLAAAKIYAADLQVMFPQEDNFFG